MSDVRYCDKGCGYKLPEEYADNETTCGACLDTFNVIEQLGDEHGREYAHNTWQVDPADYDTAIEWCKAADAGTLHEFGLPESAADAIHPDLDTDGWGWGDLADYQGAWEHAYYDETTKLCRNVIEQVTA